MAEEELTKTADNKIQKNKILAELTTFRIGGPAKFFIEAKTQEDLLVATKWAKDNKEPIFILGGGSNIIIKDEGVNGLVVKIANDEIAVRGERLECGAGAVLARIIGIAMGDSLSGLEWAVGIPRATLGGSVRGNAGAFGFSTEDLVETVEVFNLKKEKFETFSNHDCRFNYRGSIFKEDKNYLVWKVVLKMKKGDKVEIEKNISQYLDSRQKRQPKLPSAGSVFKSLTFDYIKSANSSVAELAEKSGAIKNGKLSAGWIIEFAGLKGKRMGGAKVSLEHANFIVNTSHATAEDIIILISYIKQQIRSKFNIQLQEEVQYFGF